MKLPKELMQISVYYGYQKSTKVDLCDFFNKCLEVDCKDCIFYSKENYEKFVNQQLKGEENA
jgi:hypothetical protein